MVSYSLPAAYRSVLIRFSMISKLCETWSLEELCQMDEDDMDTLLEYFATNKIPLFSEIRVADVVYEFDGGFGWW